MSIEVIIGGIGAAVGGLGGAVAMYLKNRGSSNGNGNGHVRVCPKHDVMVEKLEEGDRKFTKIEQTLDKHSGTLTDIQVGIGQLGTKIDGLTKR